MGTKRRRVLLSWSSGKDSAWALHLLRSSGDVEVVGLLTTMNRAFDRVAMHAVREDLVRAQAAATRLPSWTADIPYPCSNAVYEDVMRSVWKRARAAEIELIAFGDLFLDDVRRYREAQLLDTGLEPLFPLWGMPTRDLARTMVASGLRARITCIDPRVMPRAFAGRVFDADFLDDLPPHVDPCGERGEFHSFAFAGPMFDRTIEIEMGETLERDEFVFTDFRLR